MSIITLAVREGVGAVSSGPTFGRRFRSLETVTHEPSEITALRAALAAERLVSAELAHRNRNLLVVVSALIRRTLDGAVDLGGARVALEDLTVRLGAAHAAQASRSSRDLEALVRTTLAGFEAGGAGRVAISGPKVALTPEADRMLALALFELATNSVKHGALGVSHGQVAVDWARNAAGALRLVWRETGFTAPNDPARTGGGGALMRRIAEALDSTVTLDRGTREGISMEITFAARHLRPGAGSGPKRVLVVEDSPLIAVDLADMLEALGAEETVLAASVPEARIALSGPVFDLVLLDISLGEACSDILLPELQGVAVVVISGRDAADLPQAFAGMPLLSKPFHSDDLAAMLKTYAVMTSGQSIR